MCSSATAFSSLIELLAEAPAAGRLHCQHHIKKPAQRRGCAVASDSRTSAVVDTWRVPKLPTQGVSNYRPKESAPTDPKGQLPKRVAVGGCHTTGCSSRSLVARFTNLMAPPGFAERGGTPKRHLRAQHTAQGRLRHRVARLPAQTSLCRVPPAGAFVESFLASATPETTYPCGKGLLSCSVDYFPPSCHSGP